MKRIVLLLLILPFMSRAQVINPVPDMVFKGQLSAGRSTKTDTSAYMSIGPARGANRGFMAPMVSDTNLVIQPRRDGLLIFSLQRRNFLYWDSLSVRWRDFGAPSLDTVLLSTRAWRQKGIDSLASLPRVTAVFAGLGMKFDTIKTSGAVGVDTIIMATRPRVQKAVDSLSSVKQDRLTLTTLGTTGPATLAGSVLNIPNYSPGSGFLRNLAPIGTVPNANGMTKAGDTLRLQPASINFGGVVTTGSQTFAGEKVFEERLRVGSSGGGVIQKTDQFSVGVGSGALTSSLGTVGYNTAVGQNAGRNNTAGTQNVFVGASAGDFKSNGQANTRPSNSVFIGMDTRPAGDTQTNQIVIGYQARGNGTNTTTLGNSSTERTFVNGKLNVSVIDSAASSTNLLYSTASGDIAKTGRVGVSLLDTVAIGTRAWRQKGVDSLNSVKQDKLSLTTTGSSGPSTLVGSTLNVPNYTLSGLGGVPSNRFITINGVSYDLSADRVWNISVGGGSGTVTSVAAGTGMNFATITTAGNVSADTLVLSTRAWRQKGIDSVVALISGAGGGTVMSVSAGTGMSFPTITSNGSVSVDTSVMATRARVQKPVDSLGLVKQNRLTLTTVDSSGASTFANDTLNVPNYTLSGLGGVPTTRTLSINGTTFDLSANRSWTITSGGSGTVTSVASGYGTNFSTITSTGSVVVDSVVIASRARVQKAIDSLSAVKQNNISLTTTGNSGASTFISNVLNVPTYTLSGLGGVPISRTITINGTSQDLSSNRTWNVGTVTSVAPGYGMNFPTFTTTGTIAADSNILSTRAWRQKGIDSVVTLISNAGGGTVMSVSAGTGMNFPTITSNGAVNADTSVLSTRLWRQKGVDSLQANINLKVNIADTAAMLSPYVRGSGTEKYLPIFNGNRRVGNSILYQNGNNVAINTTTTTYPNNPGYATLELNGDTASVFMFRRNNTAKGYIANTFNFSNNDEYIDINSFIGNGEIRFATAGSPRGRFDAAGFFRVNNLSGTGARMVVADSIGRLSTQTIPSLATDTLLLSTRSWRQKGIDSVVNLISSSGGGTVLSVSAGTGMSFPTITSTGAVNADTAVLATRAWRQKGVDSLQANINLKVNIADTSTMLTPYVRSTGTNTYIPKFNPDSRNLVNSAMYDSAGYLRVYSNNINNIQNHSQQDPAVKMSVVKDGLLGYGFMLQQNDSSTTGSQLVALFRKGLLTSDTIRNGYGVGVEFSTQDNERVWRRSSFITSRTVDSARFAYKTELEFMVQNTGVFVRGLKVRPDSTIRILGLAGTGTRNVVADSNGDLRIGSGGGEVDSLIYSTRAWRQKGIDSVVSLLGGGGGGSGTVTSVSAGIGMSFPTITTAGPVNADTSILGTRLWRQKGIDSLGIVKQNVLSLTTTGSSGASTLIGSTLNIPQYTLAGLGGVPTTRTLTINGVQYDLSQDRSWTIPGGGGGGSGTVTAVNSGYGLLGGPITTAGTLLVDTNLISTRAWRQKGFDSLSNLIVPAVTIYNGNGTLSGNRTITSGGFSLTFRGDQNFIKMNNAGTARSELATDGLYGIGTPMNVFAPSAQPLIFSSGGSEAARFHSSRNMSIGSNTDVGDRLFVNGRVRIATIDSTTTANNMLYADANGVIRKAAVPTASSVVDMDSSSLTASKGLGWEFAMDANTDKSISKVVSVYEGGIKKVSISFAVYRRTDFITTGTWLTVASVPFNFRPNNVVYGSLPNFVSGDEYENIAGTAFTGDVIYEGQYVYRILPTGSVQIRVGTINSTMVLTPGGTTNAIFPVSISYPIQ